ncbi:MAG: CaiB/BaiF CoA transferase family protein [Reyranellaceae bacterium]
MADPASSAGRAQPLPREPLPHDPLPCAGLRVIDLSQGMAGPNCGMQFAAYGAEVVKIEPPEGDWVRRLGKQYGDQSALSLAVNRGKRSIALDLKKPAAVEIVRRLVADADVLLENNRPGVAERLGLGWKQMSAINPRLVYVSMTGFGQSGPYAQRVSTDTIGQAVSGMMSLTRDDEGKPMKIGYLVIDAVASLYAFQAATMALMQRDKTGRGQHVDASLMDAATALIGYKFIETALEGDDPQPLNVPAGNYRTQDGWLSITLMREAQFVSICEVLGLAEVPKDPRFKNFAARAAHAREIAAVLAERIATDTTANWLAKMEAADVLAAAVYSLSDVVDDRHIKATHRMARYEQPDIGMLTVPALPGSAPIESGPRAIAPGTGQQGPDILAQLGYGAADIERLIAERVVIAQQG